MENDSRPDFRSTYSHMTGRELLAAATVRESLVDEAKAALDAELRKRQIGEAQLAEYRTYSGSVRRREERKRMARAGRIRDRLISHPPSISD